jgi:endonuclease/exonuclease/phosphatase (EEP) superfamily protein YafD
MLPAAGIPIDHVAVNDGFSIRSHERLPDFGSDHYGILVEVVPAAHAEHP